MSSERLTGDLFVPAELREAVSDPAWLQAMLDVEAALARAQAKAGIVPPAAAAEITAACDAESFDVEALARQARGSASPVGPLVGALIDRLPGEAGGFVHWGATSQDVLDTAAMLVARRALALVDAELAGVAEACARLADQHRFTVMAGRTLLQQALPTTFGLKAAGWLDAVVETRERLAAAPLAVQLGGGAGTLAALRGDGVRVLALFADELGLAEPVVPWHTARHRVAGLAAALALVAGTLEKLARDLTLLAQTEVGEVREAAEPGRGGSTAMPQKQNPVGSVTAIACARRVQGAAVVLLGAMAQEHERAAGAWQSEWGPFGEALALTGAAAAAVRGALAGLQVDGARMNANLESSGGFLMAESVATAIAPRVGRAEAARIVQAACRRALAAGLTLREELIEDPEVRPHLTEQEIDRALTPAEYLGSANDFVDRALARYRGPDWGGG